jgi:peptidoglycan/xylan/chitin deacetylase (PgdA/CDA1 family)
MIARARAAGERIVDGLRARRRSARAGRGDERVVRRRWRLQTLIGLLMLPLSALPIYLYLTRTEAGELIYLRGRYALMAPRTPPLEPQERRLAVAFEKEVRGVPVLVYHGIGDGDGADGTGREFVVSRDNFAAQMESLRTAGYRPVTTVQLARYLESGDERDLPRMPVLVTFDDGRTDAMLQADPILRDTGMKATMFVIGGQASGTSFYYEDWDSLAEYERSGRWELQNHSYGLHAVVGSGKSWRSALVDRHPGESLDAYRARVAEDLDRDTKRLRASGTDEPVAFAYPYGDWGSRVEPEVARALADVLRSRFDVAFDQDEQDTWRPALPGDDSLRLHRLQVENWSGSELLVHLAEGAERSRAVYAERGLGYRYTELELVEAAKRVACPAPSATVVRSVAAAKPSVALTFSDGPSGATPRILDILERHDAVGTFFVLGSEVASREGILRRMLVEGNEIANGTFTHPDLGKRSEKVIRRQLASTTGAIQRAVPVRPCFVRPPFGSGAERVAEVAQELGLSTVLWSVDPRDYRARSARRIVERVTSEATPGAVVLLHDGDTRERTIDALPRIISELRDRGYRLVTLSELAAGQETS